LIQQGYELNAPLQVMPGYSTERALFSLDKANIILETVKPAEDGSRRDIILRLYESMGTHTPVTLTTSLPMEEVVQVNMLEQGQENLKTSEDGLQLEFKPFEIKTLRLKY
jgi:alpha-mannosidase